MPQAVTIRSLPRAFDLVKGMQAQGLEWGEAIAVLAARRLPLGAQMDQVIDKHLARMSALDQADRRNGPYRQHLLTELAEIELTVPRTRRFAPIAVVRAYARRAWAIRPHDPGLFRSGTFGAQEPALAKAMVGEALLPILGRPISPATIDFDSMAGG
jgi:Transposase, Mutator family